MSTTVLAPSGLEISSNDSSSEEMLKSLTPPSGDKSPRVLVDKGKTIKPIADKDTADGDGKDDTSRAASVLGKKGGEAAAKARALAEKAKGKDAAKDATETATGDEKGKAEVKGDEEAETDAAAKEAADKKKGNPRHDPQARVQEATREAKDARERAERAERELATERRERERLAREADDLRAGRQPAAREERQARDDRDPRPQPPAKPKPDDFNTYEEYLDARDEHTRQTVRHEQRVAAQREEHVKFVMGHVDRTTKAAAEDPSLVEAAEKFGMVVSFRIEKDDAGRPVVVRAADIGPKHIVGDEILASDDPPALIRYFAENEDDYQRIVALRSIPLIQRAMTKLEGRLEAATADTSTSREVSRAGSPVRSVAGSPHAAEPDVHGDIPFDVFMARKAKK